MEYLAEYSSDEETPPPPNPVPETPPAFHPPPVDFDSLVSYSEDYSMSQKKLLTVFAFLRWTPSQDVAARLQKIKDLSEATLNAHIPGFGGRYQCSSTVGQRAAVHGFFAHDKTKAINALHISLFPNIHVPAHKLPQLQQNLRRALSAVAPPKDVVMQKPPKVLEQMLGGAAQQRLAFKVRPRLHLYLSSKTGSLFVGLEIAKDRRGQVLPQFTYLNQLSRAVGEQADSLQLQYNWQQFGHAQEGRNMKYHTSLVICEVKPAAQKITHQELRAAQKAFLQLETPELAGLVVEASSLRLQGHENVMDFDL